MPAYDFRCTSCQRRTTLRFQSIVDYDPAVPQTCPHCGKNTLVRHIKRVRVLRGDDARMNNIDDFASLEGIEDADPVTMGRFMRQMAESVGEPMDDDFNEVVDRLESGQSLEAIDQSLPDIADEPSSSADDLL